jgi:hypothetical protein
MSSRFCPIGELKELSSKFLQVDCRKDFLVPGFSARGAAAIFAAKFLR